MHIMIIENGSTIHVRSKNLHTRSTVHIRKAKKNNFFLNLCIVSALASIRSNRK